MFKGSNSGLISLQRVSRIPDWICHSWLNSSNVFNLTFALWNSHGEGSWDLLASPHKARVRSGELQPRGDKSQVVSLLHPHHHHPHPYSPFLLCCSKTKLTVCTRLPLIPCFLSRSGGWLSQMFSFRKEKMRLWLKTSHTHFPPPPTPPPKKEKQKLMVEQGVVDKPGALTNCKCHWVNKNDWGFTSDKHSLVALVPLDWHRSDVRSQRWCRAGPLDSCCQHVRVSLQLQLFWGAANFAKHPLPLTLQNPQQKTLRRHAADPSACHRVPEEPETWGGWVICGAVERWE